MCDHTRPILLYIICCQLCVINICAHGTCTLFPGSPQLFSLQGSDVRVLLSVFVYVSSAAKPCSEGGHHVGEDVQPTQQRFGAIQMRGSWDPDGTKVTIKHMYKKNT